MISVKPGYFLLKHFILLLLILSIGCLFNPLVVSADKTSQLTLKLKQLEKELETTSRDISNVLKGKDNKDANVLHKLDTRISDLNQKVDDLRRSIEKQIGGKEYRDLSDRAKNLWWDVQNLREEMRAGDVSPEDYKREWGGDFDNYNVSLANINKLGDLYTAKEQPCDCNLRGLAEMLRRLAKEKSEIYNRLDKLTAEGSKYWQELVKDVRKKTAKQEPDFLKVAGKNALTILGAVAMDGIDMGLGVMSEGVSELGGAYTVGRKLAEKAMAKAPGKSTAMYEALERTAGKSTAEKFKKMFPAFNKIELNQDEMLAWARLANKYSNLENRLWDRMLKNADCMRKIGKRITGEACDIKGVTEKEFGPATSSNLAGLAQMRAEEIAEKGRIAWQGCKLCEAFEALKQLKDLKNISLKNINGLNKAVRTSLNTLFSLNMDLMKALSRKGSLKGAAGGYYDYLAAGMGFAPWGGTTVAICEGIVDVFDNLIKDGLAKNLHGNMKDVMSGLKGVKDDLKKWKDVDVDLNNKINRIWNSLLYNCDLKFDCGDVDEGPKTVPDTVERSERPDSQWKVNVDQGKWCSYYIWETPTGRKGPGKRPRGGFTPEKPGKPKLPKVPVPKKPKGGKVPPPPPIPEVSGPTIVYNQEEPEEGEEEAPEESEEDPEEEPEEEVDEEVIVKEPPPVLIVKAKTDTLKIGKAASESVANAQIKLSFLAPDLPLGDAEKNDEGFDKDPVQGVTNEDGELTLKPQGSALSDNKTGPETPLSGLAALWKNLNLGITPVYAASAKKSKAKQKPLKVDIYIPKFESYVVKVTIDKSRENWDKPETYLGSDISFYVVKHWIVEGEYSMYVVVNVPVNEEE